MTLGKTAMSNVAGVAECTADRSGDVLRMWATARVDSRYLRALGDDAIVSTRINIHYSQRLRQDARNNESAIKNAR